MSIDVADFVSERIVGNREVGQLDGLSPNRGCAVIRLGMATDMERTGYAFDSGNPYR